MKKSFALSILIALSLGCATSGYQRFYDSYRSQEDMALLVTLRDGEEPEIIYSGDWDRDQLALETKNYVAIGGAFFNGPLESDSKIVKQARDVGATVVLVSSEFTNTVRVSGAITVPNTTTTYHSGTFSGGGSFRGTSTSYGTTSVPYSYNVNRYKQWALFYAKGKNKPPLGLVLSDPRGEGRKAISGITGVLVLTVVEDTPAFFANILVGDVIIKIDGTEVRNFHDADIELSYLRGAREISFTVLRQAKVIELYLKPEW